MKKLLKIKKKAQAESKSPFKKKLQAKLAARVRKKAGRLVLRLFGKVLKLAAPMAAGAVLYANRDMLAEKLFKKPAPEKHKGHLFCK